MTEAAVISIIDEICSKIGTTTNYIIPKLSQMKFYSSLFGAIVSGIFLIILSIVVITCTLQLCRDDSGRIRLSPMTSDLMQISAVTGLVLWVCTLISTTWNAYEAVMWHVAPEAKTITYVLEMLQ